MNIDNENIFMVSHYKYCPEYDELFRLDGEYIEHEGHEDLYKYIRDEYHRIWSNWY